MRSPRLIVFDGDIDGFIESGIRWRRTGDAGNLGGCTLLRSAQRIHMTGSRR